MKEIQQERDGGDMETKIFNALNEARKEMRAPVSEFRIAPNYISGGYMVTLSSTFEINGVQVDVILARRGIPANATDEELKDIAQKAMAAAQRKFNRLAAAGFCYIRSNRNANTSDR